MPLLPALARWWRRTVRPPKPIPERLWQATLVHYAFLQRLSAGDQARLRRLATHFLAHKEFSGAHGLHITDAMAVAVAAQACLPLLHLGPPDTPEDALGWYDDFVGIVMHPADAVAPRQVMDHAGVVHHYAEVLSGEAMQDGPVMLSWPAVQGEGMGAASNVIRHGPLEYDQTGRVAHIDGKLIDLSARELGLLEVLLQRSGRLVSKEQLVERLCEWGEEVSHNAIEVYIHRLRKKIEQGPIRIATVRGLGYCLEKIQG